MKIKSVVFAFLSLIGGFIGGVTSSYFNNNTAIAQIDQQIPDQIKAKKIAIVNKAGNIRMVMGGPNGSPIISFYDNHGNPSLVIASTQGKPEIIFFKDKKKSMHLGYNSKGTVGMFLHDDRERTRLMHSVLESGRPMTALYDDRQKVRLINTVQANGKPMTSLYDNREKPRIINTVHINGNPMIALYSYDNKNIVDFGVASGRPYFQFQHDEKLRLSMNLAPKTGRGGLLFFNKNGKKVVDLGESKNFRRNNRFK